MKQSTKRVVAIIAAAGLGVTCAVADTTFTPFDSISGSPYGSWSGATITSTTTNYQINVAAPGGFGGAYVDVNPNVNAAGNTTVELTVTINVGPGVVAGPLAVLGDADGSEYAYAWYGLTSGTHVLTKAVNAQNFISNPGSTAGLDLANLSFVHIQVDQGGFPGAYEIKWENLRLIGAPNGVCATVSSFDNFNLGGTYAAWGTGTINSTPTNYQVTASGFGGGFAGVPTINTDSAKTLRLDVTLSGVGLGSQLGPIVVLEDGDGTQLKYAWYGQSPGNHVLTAALSSGVEVQAGSIPGFDFSTISFYHLQIDPGGFGGTYTVAWNNLDITGCDVATPLQITGQSYDAGTHLMTLTWTSSANKTYSILNTTDLNTPMSPLMTGIPSQGTATTTSVFLPNANAGFVRIQQE